jgi:hypothetical protein
VATELPLSTLGGSYGAFYPLVFFHVISALVGFGSIGFAGVYASRAAQMTHPEGLLGGAPLVAEEALAGTPEAVPRHLAHAQVAAPAPETVAGAGPIEGAGGAGVAPGKADDDRGMGPELEELARYFARPARFWKAVLVVPVFGALALWAEPGGGGLDQVWDITAMLVWAAAAVVAGGLVAPSLREVRSALLALGAGIGGSGPPGRPQEPQGPAPVPCPPAPAGASPASHEAEWAVIQRPAKLPEAAARAKLARYARLASRGAAACDVLFFVALALMIWKP